MGWGVKLPRRRNIKFIAGQKQSKKALGYKMLSVFIIFALVVQSTSPGLSEYIAQIVTKHQRTPQPLASQQDAKHVPALDSAIVNKNEQKSIAKPSNELAAKLADERERQLKGKAQDHRKVKLLDEGRTKNKRVFLNADGSKSVEYSAQATSYKDANGNWQDVDVSLEKNSSEKWVSRANSWEVSFGKMEEHGVQLSVEGQTFKLAAIGGENVEPKVTGKAPDQVVTYENVWENTDIQYKVSGSQIKETVVINGKATPGRYEFSVSGATLTPKVNKPGAYILGGAFKGFEIAAPTVATYDKGVITNNSLVTQSFQAEKLELALDKEWLQKQPKDAFPVTIDPTLTEIDVNVGNNHRNFASDGFICDPGQGCGNTTGYDLDYSWRFAYRAEVPSSPGQYLVNAKLHLEMPPFDGQFYYGVTGNRSIKVTKAGCTNSFNCIDTAYGEVSSTVGTSADIDLISLYRAAVEDGNTNPWMMVRGEEGSSESYKQFDDTKTKVTFVYDTLPTQSTIAIGAPVDEGMSVSTQPTLTSTVPTDPDGPGPIQYRYVIGTGKNVPIENPFNIKQSVTGVIADSGLQSVPQWVVPDSVLQDGKTYYWQAAVWDSYQGAPQVYGPTYSFKVDLRNGKDDTQAYDTLGQASVDLATGNLTTSVGTHSIEALGGEIGLGLDYNSPQRSRAGLVGQYWNDPSAARTFPSSTPEHTRIDSKVSFNWSSGSPYAGVIASDNFLARWSGYFVAPQDGTYQFGTTSDDRSRIFIDGNLHADGWTSNPTNLFGSGVTLTSGQAIPITYEFAEWTGNASAQLFVKTTDSSIAQQIIPTNWLQTGIRPVGTPHGLLGRYYTDTGAHTFPSNLDDPSRIFLTRTDTSLNRDWGANSPAPNGPKDNFMVRWTGFFTAPTADTYTFGAGSDDGVRVILNGNNTVVNAWSNHGAEPIIYASSGISLSAGQTIPITVEYYEATGNAEMGLYAKRASLPSAPDTIVDSNWLSPQEQVLPAGWNLGIDAGGNLSYDYAVINQNSVTLHDSSGETHEYRYVNGGFKPPVNESGNMIRNGDATITLQDADGRTYVFNTDGTIKSVSTPTDDRNPAALNYTYSGSPARLTQITDGVTSDRWMKLLYSGDTNCPSAPSGFLSSAPSGMLCATTSYDGDTTKFFYSEGSNGVPRLARVELPGEEMTDYGYDSAGRIVQLRDSLTSDAISTGVRTQNTEEKTDIAYDSLGRVTEVKLPAATVEATRIAHGYEYLFNATTLMHIANATEPNGFSRKVTYDGTFRTLTDTDAANLTSTMEWHAAKDIVLSETNPAGLKSTNLYDYADRVTDEYGAAPSAWYGTDRKPLTAPIDYASQTPHSKTVYDEGINGLAAAYYNVGAASNGTGSNTKVLFGSPEDHATGINSSNGNVVKTWNSAAPITPDAGYGWGASLTGDIHLTSAGTHTFRVFSDDGVRVWIDDNLVIDDWTDGGPRSHPTGTYNNTASPADSWHRIRVDYYNKAVNGVVDSDARLELYMTSPGSAETSSLGTILKPRYGLATTQKEFDSSSSVGDRVTVNNYGSSPQLGLLQSSTEDPAGLSLTTTFAYEAKTASGSFLRQTSKTLPGGNTTSYAYYGADESRQNPCNANETFRQAGMLKLMTEADPDGSGTQTSRTKETFYDASGRVTAERLNSDSWKCITYDERGRTLQVNIPGRPGGPSSDNAARSIAYNWTEGGSPLVTSVSDNSGKVTTAVDILDRTTQYDEVQNVDLSDPLHNSTSYEYDSLGRLTSKSGGETFEYNNLNRLTAHKFDGATLASPTYDAFGRLQSVDYSKANPLALTISRDNLGRINKYDYDVDRFEGSIVDEVVRSQSGEVISGTEDTKAKSYIYDGVGRLTNATLGDNTFAYSFTAPSANTCGQTSANLQANKNSNRTSQTVNGETTTYCYNAADRLIASTDQYYTNPSHNAYGNMTSGGTAIRYSTYTKLAYDSSDRNTVAEDRGDTVEKTYDALDRVVQEDNRGGTSYYGYSDSSDTPTLIRRGTGDIQHKQLQLPGGVLVQLGITEEYSLPNLHGDIMAMTNDEGYVSGDTSYYEPFGKPLDSSFGVPDNGAGASIYGYLGQHLRSTANGSDSAFMQMGARVYLPTLGRFNQVDPVEGANQNSYVYPPDPVNDADTNGEFPLPVIIFLGRIAVQYAIKEASKQAAKQVVKKVATQAVKNYGSRGIVKSYSKHALGRMAGTRGGGSQVSPQAVRYITQHGKRSYDAKRNTYNYESWLGKVVLNPEGKVVTVISKTKQARSMR